MAFGDIEYIPIQKQRYFTVYATGGSAANTNSTMIEYFVCSGAMELAKIHVHLSSPHVSVVDLMVWISHHNNSYYNLGLLSQAMLGLSDVTYHPGDSRVILESGDCIHCSMIYSAANHYGIEIGAWAINVPAGGWE